jgi:hypothetical protein
MLKLFDAATSSLYASYWLDLQTWKFTAAAEAESFGPKVTWISVAAA